MSPRTRWGAVLALAGLLPLFADAAAWTLPDALEARLEGLDPEARRFLRSGDALAYMPARQLEHEIASRDPEALAAFAEDLIAVASEMGYDAARDMGAMPLNTEAEGFGQAVPRMILDGVERAPGPFSVSRYLFPTSGVPTFAGAPVAIYPEDLVAGDVDVAIVGVPSDMGSGRRDAGHGPRVMRITPTLSVPDVNTLLDPLDVLSVVDYGDFAVDYLSTERTIGHVAAMVTETAATGAIPMLVGGDTSMLYPGVRGVAEAHAGEAIGLVHFSAHPDAKRDDAHTASDVQALFNLLEHDVLDGDHLITVGLRGPAVDAATLGWLREAGVRYHTMAEIGARGFPTVLARVLSEADAGPEKTFVSIDVSVIEPAEMVAAGRIVGGGLRVQEAARAIRHLCAAKDIVGFEITDMAPMLDYSRASAVNANTLLNACLVGVAARRAGFGPDEVHPLALDHGQD